MNASPILAEDPKPSSAPGVLAARKLYIRQSPSFPIDLLVCTVATMQAVRTRTTAALQASARRQCYSTATSGYAATASNLRINADTKVIFQGFTGKQGT